MHLGRSGRVSETEGLGLRWARPPSGGERGVRRSAACGARGAAQRWLRGAGRVFGVSFLAAVGLAARFFAMDYDNFTASPAPAVPVTRFDYVIEALANALNLYYTPLLVFFGCIGNIISLYVFYASKLRMQSTSLYLSALAISDTIFLLQLLPPWFKSMQITNLFYRPGFCQIFVYSTYTSCCHSVWLVVTFTIERFVAVLYPLRRNSMCTVTRAKTVIAALVLISMLINMPVIRYVTPSRKGCNIASEYMVAAARFNLADTVLSFSLPLGLIVLLNIRITYHLWRRECERRVIEAALAVSPELGERPPPRALPPLRLQHRITRMLLIVSTVFVVLNLPAYTMRILAYAYDMSSGEYSGRWAALQQLALMFFNTNFGINFILYCLTGQNFRRELCQSVPCLRQRARPTDDMQLVSRNVGRAGSVTSGAVYGVHQPGRRRFSDATFAELALWLMKPRNGYALPDPWMKLNTLRACPRARYRYSSYVSVGEAGTPACAVCAGATSRVRRQDSEPFIERWTFDNTRARRRLTLPTHARLASDEIEMQELAHTISMLRDARPGEEDMEVPVTHCRLPLGLLIPSQNMNLSSSETNGGAPTNN